MNSLQANQAYIFALFILNGILIGILFDVFRIIRKTFKTSDLVTYIEDIVFWIITGILTLYFLFSFNNGEIRFYIFLGILLGITLYILTISKYVIKISVKILTFFKNVIYQIVHIITYPIKILVDMIRKVFFRPISFICINIRKLFTKNKEKTQLFLKKMQNLRKKREIKKDF